MNDSSKSSENADPLESRLTQHEARPMNVGDTHPNGIRWAQCETCSASGGTPTQVESSRPSMKQVWRA